MSRIRTVKPELFRHEELFDAELESGLPLRLAFIGLFTVADCEGRFRWKPRTLKLDVLPHDTVDFSKVLDALVHHGFVKCYEVAGKIYGWIESFQKHQRLQTKEIDAGSEIPAYVAPTESDGNTENIPRYVPANTQVRTSTQPEVQEGKGKGREKEGEEERSPEGNKPPSQATATATRRKPVSKSKEMPTPPAWLQPDVWQSFVDHRKAIRKPLTPSGVVSTFSQLAKAKSFGHDPTTLIEIAVANGWQGCVFPERHHQPAPPPRGGHASRSARPITQPSTLEGAEFQAIIDRLNSPNPVIEGSCTHA